MIETNTIFTLFDKLLASLGLIREGRKLRTERVDQALRALYVALTETNAYITARTSGKKRDRKKEFALAHLWHDASIPLRVIDKEFASRCFAKGNYWMDPDAWDKDRIQQTGIAIESVLERTRDLLVR